MAVKKIGYEEIDLNLIERGRSQARQTNVNVGIEDLALSIKVQGLMEPVHLVEKDTGKYELIDGQRRFQAFRKLRDESPKMFSKIPCFCYKDTMEDWEKKSFSLNANLTQAPMTEIDKVNAITTVYNHFGKVSSTVRVTGLSAPTIRKYVKAARLPPTLKQAVEEGKLRLTSALDATDIHKYDDDPDNADVSAIFDTAKEMQKLVVKQKKRVKERVKEEPDKPIKEVIKEVTETKRHIHQITVSVESDTYERINLYKDKKDDIDTISLATVELVEEGLASNNL